MGLRYLTYGAARGRYIHAQCETEGINIDRGPQQTLNSENPWFNVSITHTTIYF